jgi:hypothetical protein
MRREAIQCDCCGAESQQGLWEHRFSVFNLQFPRDGVNGGQWNMDMCSDCRRVLHDAIVATIKELRSKPKPCVDTLKLLDEAQEEQRKLTRRIADLEECLRWWFEANTDRSRRIAYKVLFENLSRAAAAGVVDQEDANARYLERPKG